MMSDEKLQFTSSLWMHFCSQKQLCTSTVYFLRQLEYKES